MKKFVFFLHQTNVNKLARLRYRVFLDRVGFYDGRCLQQSLAPVSVKFYANETRVFVVGACRSRLLRVKSPRASTAFGFRFKNEQIITRNTVKLESEPQSKFRKTVHLIPFCGA